MNLGIVRHGLPVEAMLEAPDAALDDILAAIEEALEDRLEPIDAALEAMLDAPAAELAADEAALLLAPEAPASLGQLGLDGTVTWTVWQSC